MTPQKRQAGPLILYDMEERIRPESESMLEGVFPHGDSRAGDGRGGGTEKAVMKVRSSTVEAHDDEA